MQAAVAEVVEFPDPGAVAAREAFEDARAVEAAARGDRRAFERLYRRHVGARPRAVPAGSPATARPRRTASRRPSSAPGGRCRASRRAAASRPGCTASPSTPCCRATGVLPRGWRAPRGRRRAARPPRRSTTRRRSTSRSPSRALPAGARHVLVLVGLYGFSHEEAAPNSASPSAPARRSCTGRGSCWPHASDSLRRAYERTRTPPAAGLDSRLAALPRELPPARDLWPGIEAAITPRGAATPAAGRYALAAGIAIAALGALVGGRTAREATGHRRRRPAAARPRPTLVRGPAQGHGGRRVPRDAGVARADLSRADSRCSRPTPRKRIEQDLALIRSAHHDIQQALTRDPDSRVLLELLQSTTEQEFSLYSTVGRTTAPLAPRTTT